MASIQTDPICGMELAETEAAAQFQHKGDTIYFCSLECKRKFCELAVETSKVFKGVDTAVDETESK